MAAPATTTRSSPLGIRLKDGHGTLIAFKLDPDISFWEVSLTPPGIDGGDANECTTMHNTTWRTFFPRQLQTLTEASVTAKYDPDLYDEILAILNVNDAITIHFPDKSTLDFFGYVRLFEPQEITEGEAPMADITIQPTNYDPDNDVEAAPVMTEVAGT